MVQFYEGTTKRQILGVDLLLYSASHALKMQMNFPRHILRLCHCMKAVCHLCLGPTPSLNLSPWRSQGVPEAVRRLRKSRPAGV